MAQVCKERGIVDPAGLVMLEAVVDDKAPGQIGGRAAGVAGPDRHHRAEIDIEHDTAEIEQQRVDGGGRGGKFMAIVYKTGQAWATGSTGICFEARSALKPVRKLC